MSSYDSIIQSILDAEKQAKNRLIEAEKKAMELKEEAGEKAKSEADAKRKAMNENFEANKVDNTEDRLKQEAITKSAVSSNENLFNKNKSAVADMIVERVMNVQYALPKNVKKDYSQLTSTTSN